MKTKELKYSDCPNSEYQINKKALALKEALNTLKQVREWYVKEGFKTLAPETPIIFSKVWSVLLKNGMGKDLL